MVPAVTPDPPDTPRGYTVRQTSKSNSSPGLESVVVDNDLLINRLVARQECGGVESVKPASTLARVCRSRMNEKVREG